MKAAEAEHDHRLYHETIARAQEQKKQGDFDEAIRTAKSAFAQIAGMMQHARKNGGQEVFVFIAIDLVLELAPLVLDRNSLDETSQLLKQQRKVAKNATTDLLSELRDAYELLKCSHNLWSCLEEFEELSEKDLQRKFGESKEYRGIVKSWNECGLLEQILRGESFSIRLYSQMEEATLGKCPSCGEIATAPKSLFLDDVQCPSCHNQESFVILGSDLENE
jgi:hypothetical protein